MKTKHFLFSTTFIAMIALSFTSLAYACPDGDDEEVIDFRLFEQRLDANHLFVKPKGYCKHLSK